MKTKFKKLKDDFLNLQNSAGTEDRRNLFCEGYNRIVRENTPTVKKKKDHRVPLDEDIRKKIKEKDRMSRKFMELKRQNM